MRVNELIRAYISNKTADFVVSMNDMNDTIIFKWSAEENRHPDDGSYANILYYLPDDIANAEIDYFDYIPTEIVMDNTIIRTGKVETIYITIPIYSRLYRYLEDDNYPFI